MGGYEFQGVVFGIDGSNHRGHMGAGCCRLGAPDADKMARVGREEEGSSSNRPELGGVVLALKQAELHEDVLILCDNESVLKVIRKWVGQGGRATMAGAPDADILREILELLRARINAGRATFFFKVKSHRGEALNERADTLAERGREKPDEEKEWNQRTDRMTFAIGHDDGQKWSVWTDSVRNAFRKQAGKASCRRCTRQQRRTGQPGCGFIRIRDGYKPRTRDGRQQGQASSRTNRNGAKSVLRTWKDETWENRSQTPGARIS